MMAVRAIEVILLILLVFFVFSQIITPAIKGLPVFPCFRKSEKLKQEARETKEDLLNEEIVGQIQKTRSKVEKLRKANKQKGDENV